MNYQFTNEELLQMENKISKYKKQFMESICWLYLQN